MSRLPFMRNLLDTSSVAQSLAAAPLSSIIVMMRPAMPVMVRSPMRSIVLAVMPAVPPIPVEPIVRPVVGAGMPIMVRTVMPIVMSRVIPVALGSRNAGSSNC